MVLTYVCKINDVIFYIKNDNLYIIFWRSIFLADLFYSASFV